MAASVGRAKKVEEAELEGPEVGDPGSVGGHQEDGYQVAANVARLTQEAHSFGFSSRQLRPKGWQRKLDPDYNVMQTLQSLLFKIDWARSLQYTIEGIMSP